MTCEKSEIIRFRQRLAENATIFFIRLYIFNSPGRPHGFHENLKPQTFGINLFECQI